MERSYIGVNFPNLVSIALMVGVIAALFFGIRKLGKAKPVAETVSNG